MALPDATRFYIDGAWTRPHSATTRDLINPSTGGAIGQVAFGDPSDAEAAVAAAKRAFPAFSTTRRQERLDLLEEINQQLIRRNGDIADAISAEMGAPAGLSRGAQAPSGTQHFSEIIRLLKTFEFEERLGSTKIRYEPVGVCVLITPWNWPMNQIATKVSPALAAGCTMVLKPSETAPLSAVILTEIIHDAGVPPGVFNLIHGDGPCVGAALTAHPDVDMVSFTGSTRAGIAITQAAAPTIKRVALELGGKSANIILPDADFKKAIPESVRGMMMNSGQSCNAPSRMLVPADQYEAIATMAAQTARAVTVGAPDSGADIGPIANRQQYEKVRGFIETGLREGASLLAGGTDRPDGCSEGYFVKPTVFGDVTPEMTIAREEIFGPVLSILTYGTLDEAIAIANDTEYGLSGYVWGGSLESAGAVAAKLRTGMVHLNGASLNAAAPFGGYKRSGNGREWGVYGLREFLEVKSIYGAHG